MKELRTCLEEHPPVMLRAIAEGHNITLGSNRRLEMVDQLVQELSQPETIQRAVQSLSSREREALERILAEGGRVKAYLLHREYGEIRRFGPVSLAREKPWLDPASPVERLWYLGLIYQAFDIVGEYRGETYFVPPDLMPWLPKVEKKLPSFNVVEVEPPAVSEEHGQAIMWDVFAFLSYLERGKVLPTKGRYLPAREMVSLNETFRIKEDLKGVRKEHDAERLPFIHRLVDKLDLTRLTEQGHLKPSAEAGTWLQATSRERLKALYEAWRDDRRWNELWRVRSLHCEDTGWRNDPLLARRRILEHLSQCPPQRWFSLSSFVAAVKEIDPDFQRPDGDYQTWYIRDAETNRYLMGFHNWEKVEGALIAHLIAKPLLWLGATAIGRQTKGEDPPSAFMITNQGAMYLSLLYEEVPEPTPAPFVVQADFEVLVPQEADLRDRFRLEKFADLRVWDRVSIYQLTQESVHRLLAQGVKIEDVVTFLEKASGAPLPQNVAYTLREWGARYGEIQLREAWLLQTRDELLLKELQALPELKPYLEEAISPTAITVRGEKVAELVEKLRELGYLPRVEGE
ncbi:MAG: helicase-associated domain-containing protein [Anaerolineae bacterium]